MIIAAVEAYYFSDSLAFYVIQTHGQNRFVFAALAE